MKKYKYKDITIEQAERIMRTGYINELIFDADNKIINIDEDDFLRMEKFLKQLEANSKLIVETICEVGKKIIDIFNSIFTNLNNSLNKKITKKKFIKLLQSEGIQRNTINKILKNNTKPYTYARYYEILTKISKDKKE